MTPNQQIHAILGAHCHTVPDYQNDLSYTGILIAHMVKDGNRLSIDHGKQHYTMNCVCLTHVITRWGSNLTKLVATVFLDRYAEIERPCTATVTYNIPAHDAILLPDSQ